MLASGRSLGFGAGWPGVLRRGLSVVYSLALNVNSFRICFRYGIVFPGLPLPLGMVIIFVSTVLTV